MDHPEIKLICVDDTRKPAWVPDDLWVKKYQVYTCKAWAYEEASEEIVFQVSELPLQQYTGLWGFPKSLFFPLDMIQKEIDELLTELNLTVNEQEENKNIHRRKPS